MKCLDVKVKAVYEQLVPEIAAIAFDLVSSMPIPKIGPQTPNATVI